MATAEQITSWCVQVLAFIDAGIDQVDEIIAKRKGARMSTLIALNTLIASETIFRAGNTVWRPGKRKHFETPFA